MLPSIPISRFVIMLVSYLAFHPSEEGNKMFGLETLDELIGPITVYLAFGIACTAIVETIVAWKSIRSSNLEAAPSEFLAGDFTVDKKFVDAFYEHPLVQALSKCNDGRPSYIPSSRRAAGRGADNYERGRGDARTCSGCVAWYACRKSYEGSPQGVRDAGGGKFGCIP